MTNGIFRCIGTIPQIKEEYGGGFNLFVKLRRPDIEEQVKLYSSSGWEEMLPIGSNSTTYDKDVGKKGKKTNLPSPSDDLGDRGISNVSGISGGSGAGGLERGPSA
jgi:hypothetical protein